MDMIKERKWKDKSICVLNPRKGFFLHLAAGDIQDDKLKRDSDGLTYSRKALIMTMMALETNGI